MEFEKEVEKAKNKINECKLSDEFKANLKEKLDLEYERTHKIKTSSNESKIYFFQRKLVAAIACCVIVFSSCAFADEIEDLFINLFCNTDRIIEQAIEEGNIQTINMDYVTNDDVSVKASYLIMEENSMYVVFDVVTADECESVYFNNIEIKDERNAVLYNSEFDTNEVSYNVLNKKLSRNNHIVFCELTNSEENLFNCKKIIISLEYIGCKKDNGLKYIDCNFSCELEIDDKIFK